MKTNKQLADEIIQSINCVKRTKQLPLKKEEKHIPLGHLALLAVATVILIALNIHMFNTLKKTNANSVSKTTVLLKDYVLYKTN
ncbi:hypothetical protein [uncultured Formosa sp.]|uniref:hypothetical protein n=1 Tax=uncultured Formosa sp. TaxID=255435 RepID=UPI0026065DBF|nr:hypothetical protein [uncultured Formosa sp.]